MALYLSPVPIITDEYWSKDETMSAEESKKYRSPGTHTPLTPQTYNVERINQQRPLGKLPQSGKEEKMKLSQLLVAILVALAGLGFTPIQKTIAAPLGASIKVIVEDQYGNPAPEERVTLTGSLGNVYIGTTNVGYTIVGVIADDYVVEVHGVTGTVRAVENITQTIRIKVTYPLPGEKWFQARHFGTSLGFWLHQDILFSYKWKCYLYENGAQLNMDTSCGTYWGPIMIGFSIGEHKVMLHAITPDRMNTVYMTQTFQVYLDPATIVPTSTPVPVMSPTPNFWLTPTATPSMLTIRAWLPYSIR